VFEKKMKCSEIMRRGILLLLCLSVFSCRKAGKDPEQTGIYTGIAADSVVYARGFQIETHVGYKRVSIGNPWQGNRRLQTYFLIPKTESLPEDLPAEGIVVRTPLERVVAFSSVVCGMLNELDALSALAGVAEPEYVRISAVRSGVASGRIRDIGQASHPDIEQLLLLDPEALITNPVNEAGAGALGKLPALNLPCLEWMENHPLGQAEWIRLLGLLFDRQALADSLFAATVRSYLDLKLLTDSVPNRPSVFVEKKYGDFWHMPGGKSYLAYLLNDAGAHYVFGDNTDTGSVPFTFERILDRSAKADFWLFKYYSPQEMTYRRLAEESVHYTWFDAYKNRNVFACNTFNPPYYYQELPLHPDWVLRDLIAVFHPELLPEYRARYYFRLAE
jgi:iron complex transport system substrate-binding protein